MLQKQLTIKSEILAEGIKLKYKLIWNLLEERLKDEAIAFKFRYKFKKIY